MPGRIAILSSGLWRMRRDVEALTGLSPVLTLGPVIPQQTEAIAGWGHKPTAARARKLAAARGLPYIAIEDGFLRSVRPGPAEPPQSLILDRSGIYYDARTASDLENLLNARPALGAAANRQAASAISRLKSTRLSKYNDAPPFPSGSDASDRQASVMVIDQTEGDASIAGALADARTFERMLLAAIAENPGARIVVKLHPETLSGRKPGYLKELAGKHDVDLLSSAANPWHMFETVPHVYTVSSQLGFEALMAGCKVTCFGIPFYAGWGLTDDRQTIGRRTGRLTLNQLVHTVFFEYCRYLCAWTRKPVGLPTAVDQLTFRRDHFHDRDRKTICAGITAWKRPVIRAMLDGRAGPPGFASLAEAPGQAVAQDARVAAWGRKAAEIHDAITIEDGFLRSVGLGAGFVTPASLVFDESGIYYDPSRPSDLETILQTSRFSAAELRCARQLRELIISARLTKYNLAGAPRLPQPPPGKQVILVPGQVADDESIRLGAENLTGREPLANGGANLALLKAVRERNPDAHIIYKPHPDVEAGFRAGRIEPGIMSALADDVFTGGSIAGLFETVTSLETATSLAGFEAILRGIPVVTHGTPFYAGWGLTHDLAPCPRRTRTRSVDELTAACLMRYPVYVAPGTSLVCPATVAAELLAAERKKPPTMASLTQSLAKKSFAKLRYITINLFSI